MFIFSADKQSLFALIYIFYFAYFNLLKINPKKKIKKKVYLNILLYIFQFALNKLKNKKKIYNKSKN